MPPTAGTTWQFRFRLAASLVLVFAHQLPALADDRSAPDAFDWWAYHALSRPEVPQFSDEQARRWIRNPLDAFVLRQLRRHDLAPSAEADRRTLARRLYYDLTGLPPTPEQLRKFLHDSSDDAYAALTDQLLASPRYGEHWARHWLDVVKYADTCGYDKDKLRPYAWPYRDYVIRAFNDDKPYPRFVAEQVAGDVLYPDTADGVLGLGFVAAGPWDFIGHVEVPESKIDGKIARHLDRDDMVSNTLNTFCSVTIQCARCHDHKFDPYTQHHYYALQAVFAAVDRANRVFARDPKIDAERARLNAELSQVQSRIDRPGQQQTTDLKDELAKRVEDLRAEIANLPEGKMVYAAATDFAAEGAFKPTQGTPREIHLLQRGNINRPGDLVAPGVLPVRRDDAWQLSLADNSDEGQRRAALARWLIDSENPLTWRSIVNRVWHYHFGRGIVDTPNDFGRMGSPPTHPDLLDWLACEFRDSGGSFKQLHRLIVNSSTWRQASQHSDQALAVDAGNRWWWKMNRRRLSAEEIRDSILQVAGQLDTTMGGPGFYLFLLEKTEHSPHYEYHAFDHSDPESHRRSIYRFVVRSQPNPYMATLDCADSSQSTPTRDVTQTPLQSLTMLNSDFNLAMAECLAQRLQNEAVTSPERIQRAMLLATGRAATDEEVVSMAAFAERHGWANLARVIFNLTEFIYVD